MSATTTTIFMFVFVACLGAAVGALIQQARTPKAAPPLPSASTPENKLADPGDLSVLRVWRTSAGKLWLEVDDRRLGNKDDLSLEQRQRLVNLLLELRPWLADAAAATTSPAGKPPAYAPEAPQPATSPAGKPTAQPAKGGTGMDKPPSPQISMKSILGQIDDILQANLPDSPLKDRDIRLEEGPGGSVVVVVDKDTYVGIDAVPDPEIQTFIRRAVAEWEKIAR